MRILVLMTNEEVEGLCKETGQSVRALEACFEYRLLQVPVLVPEEGDPEHFDARCSVEIVTV